MRILFVESGVGVGGSVISLFYLVRGLERAGFDPVVVFPRPHEWSGRFENLGARVVHESEEASPGSPGLTAGPAGSLTKTKAYRTLAFYKSHWTGHSALSRKWVHLIEDLRPDLVYPNNDVPHNFHVIEAAQKLSLPVICHLRGVEPLRLPHRASSRYLAAGVAISEFVRRHYLSAGFSPEKIHRVYNGIDAGDYPWQEPSADVPKDGGKLLFLGRLAGWKGAGVLLKAAARLKEHRPHLTLTIAGDGPARGLWQGEASRLRLGEAVRFAGFVENVVPLLHEADALVHTSTEPEPFGRVILEGMAAGLPVAASSLGATPEIIVDGESGLLCPAGDDIRLAERLEGLLSAGRGRVDMARRARERVESLFSADRMVEGVRNILDRLRTGR